MEIERSMVLNAPRSRVWKALTNAREFSQWFGVKMSGDFAAGVQLELETTHPEYAGMRWPIRVERLEPESLLSWRWFPGAANPERDDWSQTTLVTFTLEEVADGTRVTVRETGFDRVSLLQRARALQDNTQGWELQFTSLAKYVAA
jgi:uncharacterized protein YndB with AHSA1/START domain